MSSAETQPPAADRKSFWETLPGILTGIAAVLTALTGVIAILHKPATETTTAPPPAPTVAHPAASRSPATPSRGAAAINIGGVWNDLNYGNKIRVRQSGRDIYSETWDASFTQRYAVGQARLSGRTIDGSYVWLNDRYAMHLTVSEDGQEITGMTRNLATGEVAPAHFSR